MKIIFLKNILFFFFCFSYKLLILCDDDYKCEDITDCYECLYCGDETDTFCKCMYQSRGCVTTNKYGTFENWYKKAVYCKGLENLYSENSMYCPKASSKKSEQNFDRDNSLTFSIDQDRDGFYGKEFAFCYFEYEQSNEADIIINIEFSSNINIYPRVVLESYDSSLSVSTMSIESNKEIELTKTEKIYFNVLLKEKYTSSPIKITISLKENKVAAIFSVIITLLFIIVIGGSIFFCICRIYKNREERRQQRLFLYQQARENMARIEQENYGEEEENSAEIENNNKQKLDLLFKNKMKPHLYKKEYNQYGGGCSICLADFKKKSKVSVTFCHHVFHYKCIYDWLYKNAKNPKCPNCNHEVLKDEDENINNKDTRIIKIKRKPHQNMTNLNNNINHLNTNDRGININNGSNIDVSQSRRPQLEEF